MNNCRRIAALRLFLEDCLDQYAADGNRFVAEPWHCLMELIDLPTLQRDCRVADDSAVDYLHELYAEVSALLDREEGRVSRDESTLRIAVRSDHEQRKANRDESDYQRWADRQRRNEEARQRREDQDVIDANPLFLGINCPHCGRESSHANICCHCLDGRLRGMRAKETVS